MRRFFKIGLNWLRCDNLADQSVAGERVTIQGRVLDGDGHLAHEHEHRDNLLFSFRSAGVHDLPGQSIPVLHPSISLAERVSAQVHERLVERAGPLAVKELHGEFGGFDCATDQAAQHSTHVAVHYGVRQSEGDAGDGGRRVLAHSRQPPQRLLRAREAPLRRNLPGGPVQVPRTRVVAQSAPGR